MSLFFVALFVLVPSQAHPSAVWEQNVIEEVSYANSMGCGAYPNIIDLQSKFDCESALLDVSNALYHGWLSSTKTERENAIRSFWQRGTPKSEPFNGALANPIVRLNIASLIGQLKKTTPLDFDVEAQREYALSFLESENKMFLVDAITALGWVGSPEDVEYLVLLIKEEDEGVAEHAVLSLINLLNGDYKDVLSELNASVKREALRKFIENRL